MNETEMLAVRFHDYGPASALVAEHVSRSAPGADEVLVRVRAAGVNPIPQAWQWAPG